MLKRVTLTRHETVESWNSWLVEVPDGMEDDRIEELMLALWNNLELDLDEEERQDEGEPSVDIWEANPVSFDKAQIILNENGLVEVKCI